MGIMATYIGNINWFQSNIAVLLRLYTTDGYVDKKLSEKEGKKLQDLASLFLTAISD